MKGRPKPEYRFTSNALMIVTQPAENLFPVFDEAFAPKPPKYDRLLQLDRNMRDHELPNFAHHFAHLYDPANGGTSDLILSSFQMDGYKEAGMQHNLNRGLSYLDDFVSPDVLTSHIPSRSSDTLSG